MFRPEIVASADGFSVFHSDFSRVTPAQPAKVGEVVILRMTGLGPTRPGVDPGQAFPADALQEVNSPVEAMVNGRVAEVLNKIGWPGTVGNYRLDVRIPDGTAAGMVGIQVTAAWIAGSEVRIAVR